MADEAFEAEMRRFMHEMRDGMRQGFASLQRDVGTVLEQQTSMLGDIAGLKATQSEHTRSIRVLQQDVRELRNTVTAARRPDGGSE